ncbi:MAG: hypothetical protein KGZ85_15560 [Ignavibacterium sp.]|nr:hypothetical protein [Ignavibacterium sp.]
MGIQKFVEKIMLHIVKRNNKKKIAAAFIAFAIIFYSCASEEEHGTYYKGNFIDTISIVSESDTANIVIEQIGLVSIIKENIPFSEEIINTVSDSINLKLIVSFGSYSPSPLVINEVSNFADTFYLWYSTRNKDHKTINKDNAITKVTTSLKIEYVSIDSIVIQRNHQKSVNIFSRIVI